MAEEKKESGKMRGRVHLETTKGVSKIIKDYYEGQKEKQAKGGQKVAWCGVAVPKQILQAMDILAFYPEQYATVVASAGASSRFISIAEEAGYAKELCGYARVNFGYILEGMKEDAPRGGMAKPDMMITTTVICDTRIKWFEKMAEMLDVPLYVLEIPTMPPIGRKGATISAADMETAGIQVGRSDAPHLFGYAGMQYQGFIKFIEEQCGYKLDQKKLGEITKASSKVGKLRREINEYRKVIPCPMGSADAFKAMFPGMYMPGTKVANEFYEKLKAEIIERVENKISIVKDEIFRLVWSGIPFWYNMGLLNYFEDKGGVVVIDTTYGCGAKGKDLNPDRIPKKWGMNTAVASVIRAMVDYNCDGAVLSYTPTCRPLYIEQLEIKNALMEELGAPSILLESDMVDPSSFNEAQSMQRIDAFIELMIEHTKERKWKPMAAQI